MYTIYVTLLVFNLKSSRELKTYGVGCTREVAVGMGLRVDFLFCSSDAWIQPFWQKSNFYMFIEEKKSSQKASQAGWMIAGCASLCATRAIIQPASWGRFALTNCLTCQKSMGVPLARRLHRPFPLLGDATGMSALTIPLLGDALGMLASLIWSPARMAVFLESLIFRIFVRFTTGVPDDRICTYGRFEV